MHYLQYSKQVQITQDTSHHWRRLEMEQPGVAELEWQNLKTSQIPNLLQRSHGTGRQTSQEQAAAASAQNAKNLNPHHVLNKKPLYLHSQVTM